MFARGRVGHQLAAPLQRRAGVAQRHVIHPLGLEIERGVDAVDLFLQQHVTSFALQRTETLVVGGFEFLEGGTQFVEAVARRIGDAGLVLRRSLNDVEVHVVLLVVINQGGAPLHLGRAIG